MPEFLVHTTTRGVANAIKEEVKKKTPPARNFSFFAAHWNERELFWPSAPWTRLLAAVAQRLGFSLAVFIAFGRRSLSVLKPAKQNGGQVPTMVLSETRGL